MKELFKNPHTFDMNEYYSGMTYVIGGRDFENEEKETPKKEVILRSEKNIPIELDWSFLKSIASRNRFK